MTSLMEELRQKPRLRLGIMAAVFLLWLFALLELEDRVSSARAAEKQLQIQIARTRALAQEDHWGGYREKVHRNLTQYRSLAWREESEGRIQAHFQDWLRDQLAKSGLRLREMSVSLPQTAGPSESGVAGNSIGAPPSLSELPSEMRVVRARLVLDFQVDSFHELLDKLSRSERWLWVERMSVQNWGTRTLELELGALFVIGPREGV